MRKNVALESAGSPEKTPATPSRRGFLKWAAGGIGAVALAPDLLKAAVARERYLFFHNPNVGETVRRVYWTPREGYVRESIAEISWALRDYHNDQVKNFDPNVLDQLYALQIQMGLRQPVNVISGYRSPITNGALYGRTRGVARNSLHMHAMAMDLRLPDGRVSDLYRAACALGAGGVGYYPGSNFVHIDSGPVRYWG